MKPTFLEYQKPLLCCMIPENTPDRAISAIMNAHYDGADAFGFQLEGWKPEHLTEETLRQVFKYCLGKPIYVTSYRHHSNEGKTDDECAEVLFTAIRAGATLVDVMADTYDPQPYELTHNAEAVEKQKALIERFHAAGAEVLMSCHTHTHLSEDEAVACAKERAWGRHLQDRQFQQYRRRRAREHQSYSQNKKRGRRQIPFPRKRRILPHHPSDRNLSRCMYVAMRTIRTKRTAPTPRYEAGSGQSFLQLLR